MNITYDYYRIFYYVGRYGSFTKAAEALENSQPNITRAMNNLEAQLGVILFSRSKKGIVLTAEGEKLFDRVSNAFEQISYGEREIDEAKKLGAGCVKIGVSEIALHEILFPVLTDFIKEHSHISVQITNESTPSAVRSLRNGLVDFALVTSPLPDNNFCCEKICDFNEFPVLSRRFKEFFDEEMSICEILKFPLISLSYDTATRKFYDDLFLKYKMRVQPQITVATANQILPMVDAGLGIGFIPESMLSGKKENIYKI